MTSRPQNSMLVPRPVTFMDTASALLQNTVQNEQHSSVTIRQVLDEIASMELRIKVAPNIICGTVSYVLMFGMLHNPIFKIK